MGTDFYDITVIGGGPVGMFAAFYAGLRDAKVQLVESLPQLGGQVQALFPLKTITDVGGLAGLTGAGLIKNLKRQMKLTHSRFLLGQSVEDVASIPGGYLVKTARTKIRTRAVIIATGLGAFRPRKLMAKHAGALNGRRVFYSVNQLDRFRHRVVLVAGGGDSALGNALLLSKVAKEVILLHRRSRFRGLEATVDRVKRSPIKLVTPYLIRQLDLTADRRVQVTAKRMRTQNDLKRLTVDDLVVNYGFVSDHRALQNWQIHPQTNHGRLAAGFELRTSLPGIYVVGDAATYPGKDTLISTGFGEVPIAVNAIMRHLYPHRRLPLHSTSLLR